MMDEQQRKQLNEQGYLIFKNVLSPTEIEAVLGRLEELWAIEGDQAGEENYIEPGVRMPSHMDSDLDAKHAAPLSPRERELLGLDDE